MVQVRRVSENCPTSLITVTCDTNIIQGLPTSCAVKCQQIILRDYGYEITENDLCIIASENGWFVPENGVRMQDNGKLLGCFGVGYQHSQDNSIAGLKKELQLQHRIMVNVNRSKLVGGLLDKHDEACHALIVTDVDDVINNTVSVIDPANGDVNRQYPLLRFIHAWKDSDYYMLSTITPALYQYDPTSKMMIEI